MGSGWIGGGVGHRVALGIITGALLVGLETMPSAAAAQEEVELPAEDRVLEPALEEVVRVGSLDGELWETFGEVRDVAFDGAGNLYVFDPRSARVVVVAPDGTFLREVGEAGEGPGELRTPLAFTVFRDGRVVIVDVGHRAYLLYGSDGRFLRQLSMAGEGGLVRLGGLQADPTGRGVVHGGGGTMVSMQAGPGASLEPPDARPVELLELDGEMATARTLVEAWQPPREGGAETLQGGGMSFRVAMAGPRTFEPGLHVGVLPDGGVAVADSSTWTVTVTGPDGAVRRVLRRPLRPRPVTERVEEAERRRQLRELEEGEGPRMSITTRTGDGATRTVPREAIEEMMRGRIEQMRFYPEIPVIREMRSGWSGTLWVQRRSADDPGEPGPVDLVTPEGVYLGTIPESVLPLPDAFGPGGLAAFVERDAYDVPTVVVRRLPEALR